MDQKKVGLIKELEDRLETIFQANISLKFLLETHATLLFGDKVLIVKQDEKYSIVEVKNT
jgi:hypothetical protein